MGFRRVVLLAVSIPTVACSAGGRLGTAPDGGAWMLPDAHVTAMPVVGFTVANMNWNSSIRLACSPGGDGLARYTDAVAGGQVRRFHGGAWGEAIPLPTYSESVEAVAMAPDGTGTFSWVVANEESDPAARTDTLNVATLSPAGTWSQTIAAGDGGIGWWQEPSTPLPALALDESGTTLMVWSRIDQAAEMWPAAVWSSQIAPDGSVTRQMIDRPAGTWSTPPSVIARGPGEAVATWGWSDGQRSQLLVARRVGSTWAAPKILEDLDKSASEGLSDRPRLAGGRAGALVLVYLRVTMAGGAQLVARQSADGETWTPPFVLAAGNGVSSFEVADNGAGGAVVAWSDLLDSSGHATIRVFDPMPTLPASGWSPPFVPVPDGATQPFLAEHPDGRIAILYTVLPSPTSLVLQRFDPGAGWRPAEQVGGGGALSLCYAGDTLLAAWNDGQQGVVGAFP